MCVDSEGQVALALWQQHLVAENESEENEFACCQDFFPHFSDRPETKR